MKSLGNHQDVEEYSPEHAEAGRCVYALHPAVAIESFGEHALVLHCEDLRLAELNATAADLLSRLDGQATLQQVAAAMAADYGQPLAAVWADVQTIVSQVAGLGLVQQVPMQEGTAGTKGAMAR